MGVAQRPARDGRGPRGGLCGAHGGDGVDGVQIGEGGGFDDVGRRGAAAEAAVVAFDLQLQGDLALGVLALGDAADDEFAQVRVNARHALDGLEDGVDRAVAERGVLDDLAVGPLDLDGGRGQHARCRRWCAG